MGSKFIWYGKHIHYTYRMQLPPCHGDYPVWLCSHPARKSQWLVCNRDVGFAGMLCLIRYASPWIWNASVTRIAQKPICAIWGVGVSERCWRYFMILQVNAMAANTLLPYITLWTCNHYDDPMGLIVTRYIQYAKYQVSLVLQRLWFGIGGWNLLFTWDNQTKWNLGYITWPTERFCRNCFQTAECLTTSGNRQDSVLLVLDEAGCSTGELCDLAHIPELRKLNILPYRQIAVFYVTKERVLCNTVLGKQLHACI